VQNISADAGKFFIRHGYVNKKAPQGAVRLIEGDYFNVSAC
jgi:2-methylaconitate cis-trans-isomerase PrpF